VAGRDARLIRCCVAVTLCLTPVAWLAPEATLPGEAYAELAAAVAWRPTALASEMRAASVPESDAEDAALVAQLERRLDIEVGYGLDAVHWVGADVRRAFGRGAAGRESVLELMLELDTGVIAKLQDAPVAFAGKLLGHVAGPDPEGGPRQAVRVDLLGHRKRLGDQEARRRWIGVARAVSGPDAEHQPVLRLLAEPAAVSASYRLRVPFAVPRQLDTWSDPTRRYVVYTVASDLLGGRIPAGLELGRLVDTVYERFGFVVRRHVEPNWDPRSIARVAIILDPELAAGLGAVQARRRAEPARPFEIVAASPRGFDWRRYLLRAPALLPGEAVRVGKRCLGIVRWRLYGFAVAEPLGLRGRIESLLWLGDGRALPLVVRGKGLVPGGARFEIVHPEHVRDLTDGQVFTGMGDTGYGLRVGRVVKSGPGWIEVATFGPWEDAQ